MRNSDTIINERLTALSPVYQDLVMSEYTETIAETLGEAISLSEQQINILTNGIRLWLLFFFNKDELVEFIATECDLTFDTASDLAIALTASLPAEIIKIQTSGYALFNSEIADPEMELNNEIAKTEQEIAALSEIHTMEDDVQTARSEQETVYQSSSQSELIDTQVSAPKLDPSVKPTWDTER